MSAGQKLTAARVEELAKKYKLENRYYFKGTAGFDTKLANVRYAHAYFTLREEPLLLEDSSLSGSGKEGFVLTNRTLYHYGGFLSEKERIPIECINNISARIGSTYCFDMKYSSGNYSPSKYLPNFSFSTNKNEITRKLDFWKELLQIDSD